MNEKITPLPCPFCGGEAKVIELDEDGFNNEGGFVVGCTECGASTSVRFACGDDPVPLVVEAWNTRKADKEPPVITGQVRKIEPPVTIYRQRKAIGSMGIYLEDRRSHLCECETDVDAWGIANELNAYPALTARVKELEEACLKTTASLFAAISLLEGGGKRAAWSDKVFYQMIRDYKAAAEKGRSALNKEPTT